MVRSFTYTCSSQAASIKALRLFTTPGPLASACTMRNSVTGSVAGSRRRGAAPDLAVLNVTTDVITWSTNHGLTTGQSVRVIGTVPTGWIVGQMYYVNALSATTFALYNTLADALADTSRVNLTATTTGATMTALVTSNAFNVGLAAVGAVVGSPGATTMAFDINLSNALANTKGAMNYSFTALAESGGTVRATRLGSAFETYTSTTLAVIPHASLATTGGLNPGTWVQQELVRARLSRSRRRYGTRSTSRSRQTTTTLSRGRQPSKVFLAGDGRGTAARDQRPAALIRGPAPPAKPIEKVLHGYFEHLREFKQHPSGYAIDCPFVFLHLLERHPESIR
jgi:hypothetical protein